MRLFVAINFTDDFKSAIISAREHLKAASTHGNFSRDENLHLTLAFIGETPNVRSAITAISRISHPPFDIKLERPGRIGRNLYYIGLSKNDSLTLLAEKVSLSLEACGFSLEKRAFLPHITIGREVERGVTDIPLEQKTMTVNRISLMKSERINGRLTYTEIYGKNL